MQTANKAPEFTRREFDALAAINYEFYLQYVIPGYRHGRHTKYIANKLQDIEKKHSQGIPTYTIFTMPPRHSKSFTISETFPSWFIGRDKRRRVILASYGDTLARKFGLANIQKVEGDAGRIFGMALDKRQNAATNWQLETHKGGMISAGIGGAVTGQGADLLIIDDPIRNRRDANSPTYRETVWGEWKSTLSTRLQPGASVIIILTRWHEDDIVGRLLEHDPREWEVISLPAEAEDGDLLGREPGQPLWPERGFDEDWLETTKLAAGPLDWASLYQQRPSPQSGTLFKREYWRFFNEWPDMRQFERIIQSWDCTFKEADNSDYVAGGLWGKIGPDYYLLDLVREKMGITGTMQAIRNMLQKWPQTQGVYIEDKANGPAVIEMLRREISGIIPVNPQGGKVVRGQAVLPVVAAGNVYLPAPQLLPIVNDFINEASSFPYGKNDDKSYEDR